MYYFTFHILSQYFWNEVVNISSFLYHCCKYYIVNVVYNIVMMMLRVYCRNYLFIFMMSIMWFIHISRLFSIFRILPNPLDACYIKYPRYFILYAFLYIGSLFFIYYDNFSFYRFLEDSMSYLAILTRSYKITHILVSICLYTL